MMDRKALLRAKLEEARKKRVRLERERLINGIEGFERKYRFADEAEAAAIDDFIEKLDFIAPGRVAVPDKGALTAHEAMYLCFLGGSEELLPTYVFGSCADFMADTDRWLSFSPFLLLIDADFHRYIFMDDEGVTSEASV